MLSNVEHIIDPSGYNGFEKSDGLLAILYYSRGYGPTPGGTHFITPVELSQQVAVMHRPQGEVVPAHKHLQHQRIFYDTSEVLIIKSGALKITFFNLNDTQVAERRLEAGDIAILIGGGHKVEFLLNTEMVECKLGPYRGKERDKVEFELSNFVTGLGE